MERRGYEYISGEVPEASVGETARLAGFAERVPIGWGPWVRCRVGRPSQATTVRANRFVVFINGSATYTSATGLTALSSVTITPGVPGPWAVNVYAYNSGYALLASGNKAAVSMVVLIVGGGVGGGSSGGWGRRYCLYPCCLVYVGYGHHDHRGYWYGGWHSGSEQRSNKFSFSVQYPVRYRHHHCERRRRCR